MTHIIVYSHGFGVEKDDRGLFTDIAASMPDVKHIMFDYNEINRDKNELIAPPLDVQAQKLKEVINQVRSKYSNVTVDIIAHSQGCLAAALAKPEGIRRMIFTAPPPDADIEAKIKRWRTRYGSNFTTTGTSYLARKDGSTTIVPPTYWTSIKSLDAQKLYNALAGVTDFTIITATQDEVLGEVVFHDLLPITKIIKMATGHNFDGEDRVRLIDLVTQSLELPA